MVTYIIQHLPTEIAWLQIICDYIYTKSNKFWYIFAMYNFYKLFKKLFLVI